MADTMPKGESWPYYAEMLFLVPELTPSSASIELGLSSSESEESSSESESDSSEEEEEYVPRKKMKRTVPHFLKSSPKPSTSGFSQQSACATLSTPNDSMLSNLNGSPFVGQLNTPNGLATAMNSTIAGCSRMLATPLTSSAASSNSSLNNNFMLYIASRMNGLNPRTQDRLRHEISDLLFYGLREDENEKPKSTDNQPEEPGQSN